MKLMNYAADIAWFLGVGLIVAGVAMLAGAGWALIAAGAGILVPVIAGQLRRA